MYKWVLVIEMTNHLNPPFVPETSYIKDVFPPPENHSQEWRYVSRKLPAEPWLQQRVQLLSQIWGNEFCFSIGCMVYYLPFDVFFLNGGCK